MPYSLLTTDALNLQSLLDKVRSPRYGGYVTFTGDVRDHDAERTVTRLHYTAYRELALKELDRIVTEAEARWNVSCAAAHRIGTLVVGECSVAVAVGAGHRVEAFEACRWVIDTIKTDVPIWKLEEFTDGAQEWIEGVHHVSSQSIQESVEPVIGHDRRTG